MAREKKKAPRTEIVRTREGLHALRNSWSELVDGVPDASLFLTWDWISCWWSHYHQDGELWILTAWDAAGKLIGLAPWMLSRARFGPLRARCINFIAGRPPLHQNILARPQDCNAVSKAFMGCLIDRKEEWDLVDLKGLAQGSSFGDYFKSMHGRCYERHLNNLYVPISGDWETFCKHALSYNQRKSLRYYRNRLEREFPGQVVFQQITHRADLDNSLDALVELNRNRQHSKGIRSAFDDERFVEFNRDFARLALERGWLRLYLLKVDGQVIAAEYGLCYRHVLYGYQTGFDIEWARFSPGQLMLGHLVQQAFEDGVSEVDLLLGEHPYKLAWTDQRRRDSHLMFSSNTRGESWLAASALLDSAISLGREVFSEANRQKINTLLSTAKRSVRNG